MNDNLILILAIIISAGIGGYLGMLFYKLKSESKKSALEERENLLSQNLNKTETERDELRREKEFLNTELTRKNTEYENLKQLNLKRDEELEKRQEQLRKDFELLATKILDEKSEKFTLQNKENLKTILDPLQEKIKLFEDKVDKTHKESIDYHAALRQQILGLKELNTQMSKEAINLTNALKGDSKAQGDWGETQLEIILEKAGLSKDIHFSTQGGYRDEDGKLKKPDFIINLPDNKHLIVDSKVSLTAYEGYYNAENEDIKDENLKKHITSIRKHIKELGEKQYTDLYGINAPDYVLMFVPIEPALLIALNENNKLYLEALDKDVVLVSTSTLLATLSTVSSIWKQEDQKKNVLEIAKRAGAMYDKFEGFVQDLLKIGKSINTSKESYDSAMNKLVDGKGNLISSIEKIKKLGAKAKKALPENILNRAEDVEE
ncbi:MAG: DNA recombination protein RmuC [Flavobacteriaceae bacterium]|nr:DNA recombination protein RmuC [Flavobacteriaceae bacterium]